MKINFKEQFVAFILTNGRPNNVLTYKTLRKAGYTGQIRLLVDDLDKTKAQYLENYKDEVIIFDKASAAAETDSGDNFKDWRSIIYARNVSFQIAKQIGFKYFIQLDDDYITFYKKFNPQLDWIRKPTKKLDVVFEKYLNFLESSEQITCVALAQGGDFIGGPWGGFGHVMLKRKIMNTFICSVEKPFKYFGKLNDDVNTYVKLGNEGTIFFTSNLYAVDQKQTQANPGGLTDLYKDYGTYVKSFYSIMYQPSSVEIRTMGITDRRYHHFILWKYTVPKIIRQTVKK